ncbi:Uncharacterised protein [Acinetobacter baumannii]|nr:Uncharacterised protein [Acinetobacter baumannii]
MVWSAPSHTFAARSGGDLACGKVVVTANGCNAHPSPQSMWHLVHRHRAPAWRYASRCFSPMTGRLGSEVLLQMPSRRKTHSISVPSWLSITRVSDADGLSAEAVRLALDAATPPRRATMRHRARRHGSSFRSRRNDRRMPSIHRFADKFQDINRFIAGNRSNRKADHGPPASSPERPDIKRNTQ